MRGRPLSPGPCTCVFCPLASSRPAFPPKPKSRHLARLGYTRSSTMASASSLAGRQPRAALQPPNALTYRFPLIMEALAKLRSRSCIIDGEAAACDDNARSHVDRARSDHRRTYPPPEIACKLKNGSLRVLLLTAEEGKVACL